ncbi:MAG: peptide chain release factor N(5)-glutamine methyltransferase [Campylobacter sp.]|nr:peptide chain release factor N(5)-glutamine methyltransferase [Campylobacter sp.]
MRVFDALKKARAITDSDFVAREIVKNILEFDDKDLILNLNSSPLRQDKFYKILEFANLYQNGTPLEYLTGKAKFLNREFLVDENVLIPRFETEILVLKTLEICAKFNLKKLFEIGTGSGIIAISLCLANSDLEIFATDISLGALNIAKQNALKLGANVEFFHSAYIESLDKNCDILVSNPPYIANSYKLDKFVANEPKTALFGGERGDEILKNIILIAKKRAKFLACEIGYDQKESLSEFLELHGFESEFYKDLAGFDRGFVARNLNFD